VPILAVTEVVPSIEITPVPGAPEYILGLTNLRGKVLPVLDLEKKFDLNRQSQNTRKHIMFAESEQKVLFGILVDRVKEVLKIPADVIAPTPQAVKSKISSEYLGGVIVLGGSEGQQSSEERMLLILDLQKILSDKNVGELQAVQNASPQATINEGSA
jgi:purine-binding chemotaxis protein CheW